MVNDMMKIVVDFNFNLQGSGATVHSLRHVLREQLMSLKDDSLRNIVQQTAHLHALQPHQTRTKPG